jgi:1,4-dihydroxy-2-naphthoate octaprenyltransferase
MKKTFWQGFWRLADPKISLASFAGVYLAASMAAAEQSLHMGWLALTVLGVFCVEVAKNASGEVVDYDSGTDLAITAEQRSPFSGGKRVLVDGLLSRQQAWWIAGVFFSAAILIGLVMVILLDVRILWPGVIGMALAWYYHGGIRLSYRGLGELAVALAYGPIIVGGTYFVQVGTLSPELLNASGALGLLVAAFLWINEFPDYSADQAAGKNNLVVRLGRRRAAVVYGLILGCAYAWLAVTAFYYQGAAGLACGLVGLVPAVFSAQRLMSAHSDVSRLIPAQAASLASFVLMALAAGTGYVIMH